MAVDSRILNLTRNCKLKLHQAVAKIESGVADWVEKNVSIRELTLQEIVNLRAERERQVETRTLEPSELPHLIWEPPANQRNMREHYALIRQAREFAANG